MMGFIGAASVMAIRGIWSHLTTPTADIQEYINVIRHCDKPKHDTDDYGECTETGFERADYIARLWGGDYAGDAAARYDPPALLLARAPTGTGGQGDGVQREAHVAFRGALGGELRGELVGIAPHRDEVGLTHARRARRYLFNEGRALRRRARRSLTSPAALKPLF